MPYIKQKDRTKFEQIVEALKFASPQTPGELNYLFSMIAAGYVASKGLNYQNVNDVVGALEGAKLEIYRRIASPYEDRAIKRNGDL